jgi:hypothetical protein
VLALRRMFSPIIGVIECELPLRPIGGSAFAGALTNQRPQGDLSW